MRFLKLLFWIFILVAFALFSASNWTTVTINLWGGLVLDTVLPLLVLVAFLIGLIPTFILHRATRWSLNRKLDSAQRSIQELRAPPVPPPAPAAAPIPATPAPPSVTP